MKLTRHTLPLLLSLSLVWLTGCGQQGPTEVSPVAPTMVGVDIGSAAASRPGDRPEMVSEVMGRSGGVLEVGRITVNIPGGALPHGEHEMVLDVQPSWDYVDFVITPDDIDLDRSVILEFDIRDIDVELSFYRQASNGDWMPIPSTTGGNGKWMRAEVDELGAYRIGLVKSDDHYGRAGW